MRLLSPKVLKSAAKTLFVVLTLGVAAAATGQRRSGRMGEVLAIFLFVLLGGVIAAILTWYIMTIRDVFFSQNKAGMLGSVQVVGNTDVADSYMKVLPRLIVARLETLRNETNEAIESLKEARDRRSEHLRPQTTEYVAAEDLPRPFSEPIEVELTIGDVDVGPLVSFFLGKAYNRDSLEITAVLDDKTNQANVYGHLPGSQGYSFVEKAKDGSPDEIAKAAAAAVIKEVSRRDDIALAALSAEDYASLLKLLSDYAQLLKIKPFLKEDFIDSELREFNKLLERLASRFSRWRDLQWLAAEIAEVAEEWKAAYEYYRNLDVITPADHKDYALIARKLRSAEEKRALILKAEQESERSGRGLPEVLALSASERRRAAAGRVPDELAEAIRSLIGLEATEDVKGQRIGIVGPTPWKESLEGLSFESPDLESVADPGRMRDYITEVVQAVRLIVGNATFVFAELHALDAVSIVENLEELAEADVGVILLTLSSPEVDVTLNEVISQLAAITSVVVSAGNERGTSVFASTAEVALVAGATTLDGEPAAYSATARGMVWAPSNIPVIAPRSGAIERRSGTPFSAAITAGVVAVLRTRFPEAEPAQLHAALLETARPLFGRSEPRIIDAGAAAVKLEENRDK